MYIALTLLAISLLVVLHELGHFWVARACDMRVSRFSVGFGPALLQKRIGEVTWQLAAIPFGGYVLIDGMGGEGSEDGAEANQATAPHPRMFSQKPMWQRLLVIFAGPAANFLTCAALLAALGTGPGLPQLDLRSPRLGALDPAGAAAQAGLQAGDTVLSIDAATIADWDGLVGTVRQHPGVPLQIVVRRGDTTQTVPVTPARGPQGIGLIGATPFTTYQRFTLSQSVPQGCVAAWKLTVAQANMLWGMLRGQSTGKLTGLPGIVKTVSRQAQQGLWRLCEQMAYLSIGLCLLNLLPIPALDGSRLLLLLIEMVRRRPLDERIEGVLHTAGFALLFGVMIFVSVRDLL